jgi:ATP-binding cassette, subfamily G (WHITE), member 2
MLLDIQSPDNPDQSGLITADSYTEYEKRSNLVWKNLSYTVTTDGKITEVLKGVSGFANPGEILAIMGSSGSGKTSLLSILANQIFAQRSVEISGSIEVNGRNIKLIDYSNIAKYVTQQDILLPTITAREALMFAAKLKVKGDHEFLICRVNQVLEDLRLTKVADNLIGNHIIKGLSGGQKRRVSIGVEFISEPNILILDEPTSGLDSITAEILIDLLKVQAEKNKTIILTIHQPSSNVFYKIDRLILIVEGNFIYQGCTQNSASYFGSLGYPTPELTNPPDHFMRVLYVKNRNNLEEAEEKKLKLFIRTYKNLEKLNPHEIDSKVLEPLNMFSKSYHPGLKTQMKVLLTRTLLNAIRNPLLFVVKFVHIGVICTIINLLFNDLGYDDEGVQAREGVLSFLLIDFMMLGLMPNSLTFNSEKPLFLKEYKEGLYGAIPYYFSKIVSEFPVQVVSTILYANIIYFVIGLNSESPKHFFTFLLICLLITLIGSGVGNFVGAFARNIVEAQQFAPVLGSIFMVFGGFICNNDSLNTSFAWIKYTSPLNYGFQALTINEFEDSTLDQNVRDPLDQLGFSGEPWSKILALFIIEMITVVAVIFMLKMIGRKA